MCAPEGVFMRRLTRLAIVGIVCLMTASPYAVAQRATPEVSPAPSAPLPQTAPLTQPTPPASTPEDRSTLPDAKIITFIIAVSVAAYLAMGRPCACPYNTDKAGRACGARSAHSKPNGYSPLCYPTDITAAMIGAYRKGTTITDKAMATALR